jgi:hypothetical protein
METLEPSPNEFVVRERGTNAIERARVAGSVELIDAKSGTWVLRTAATQARAGWQSLAEGLGTGLEVLPVLRDRDGVAHYPTGEVTVRFAVPPSDAALRAFTREHGLALARRNELEPRQVVFSPAEGRDWLPDVVERIAQVRGVERAWANTVSRYQRA